VIFAFDPGARGRVGVERFQAAAEKYGYIVAGSLNSRNGPWEPSVMAARAMMGDLERRFSIDPKRMYTAGQSGGARVAMQIALDSSEIAGVFASSAGFPDDVPKTVPFAIFGKTAADDFNYLELRALDRVVATPHRVVITDGGHAWMSSEVAIEAVEWMEVQAIKSGRRPRDQQLLDRVFDARLADVNAQKDGLKKLLALDSLVADFQGLSDVSKLAERAAALRNQQDVKRDIAEDRLAEQREAKQTNEIYELRGKLDSNPVMRGENVEKLKARVIELSHRAKSSTDSIDRRIARRILSGFGSSFRGVRDPQLQEVVTEARSWNPAHSAMVFHSGSSMDANWCPPPWKSSPPASGASGCFSRWLALGSPALTSTLTASKFLRVCSSVHAAAPSGSLCRRKALLLSEWHTTQRACPARFLRKMGSTFVL
jgi:dienelactone hydrolase